MHALGRFVVRQRRWVVGAGLVAAVLAAFTAAGALGALSLNRFEAPGSESVRAGETLAREFGTGTPNVLLLVTATSGTVDGPEVAAAGAALTRELAGYPGVGDAGSYWTRGQPSTLRSEDRRHAVIAAWVPGDADHVRGEVLPELSAHFVGDHGPVRVRMGGADEVFRQVMEHARADFVRAELILIPLALMLLWLIYRRLVPALLTLGIGLFAMVGALALVRAVVALTEVSTFAANLILVMGLALGVDYGLFMVFRFREEVRAGAGAAEAVVRTVATAGRTVLFSGATVAVALSVLLVFPYPFLRSFAYAGIAVTLAAAVGAVVVLPAALALAGARVLRRSPPSRRGEGRWYAMARRVMVRPVLFGGVALGIVLVLGAPFLGVRFGLPDDRILPASAPVRQVYDQVRDGFDAEDWDALHIVATATPGPTELTAYAASLSRVDGIVRVDSAAGTYVDGERTGTGQPTRFGGATGTWLAAVPSSDRLAADPVGLVRDVRAVPAPVAVLVGGYPAELADYRNGVTSRLPLLAILIVVVTFAVLFLMTGSVVVPLKATVLNVLSLSVMFGALVWIFQDGNLSGVLGFTPTGVIEPSIPILMFCVAYGLSMDYEVFLVSRIREEYLRTGLLDDSVPRGVQHSAPLVSAAALILAVSFATYATSGVVFLQMLGVGMALTVIVEATLIRGVLVPAFMRLAGPLNWWAPPLLRRWHARIGPPDGTHRYEGAGVELAGSSRTWK
jgi:RND superfamily putative drug exporter